MNVEWYFYWEKVEKKQDQKNETKGEDELEITAVYISPFETAHALIAGKTPVVKLYM